MMNLQQQLQPYLEIIEKEINTFRGDDNISFFYDPIRYILSLKGKRIRPLLTMLSAEVLDTPPDISRYPAAAVELLHNFTLMHDDIMDQDDFRRGQLTVHKKWDINAAILSGDGLMGLAFHKLLLTPRGDVTAMARRFAEAMLLICEGQGQDKMFETSPAVSSQAYLQMIERKTAVLIELSCELGAMVAESPPSTVHLFREFGYALGLGFQIQDDVLDVVGNETRLGKKTGSDLSMHKQTLLTIKLREKTGSDEFFNLSLDGFRRLLNESGVLEESRQQYARLFDKALNLLDQLPANPARERLMALTESVKNRSW